jgi:hypothetical protein
LVAGSATLPLPSGTSSRFYQVEVWRPRASVTCQGDAPAAMSSDSTKAYGSGDGMTIRMKQAQSPGSLEVSGVAAHRGLLDLKVFLTRNDA